MYIRLNPPPAIQEQRDREVAEVEQFFKARKLALAKAKREKLDSTVKRWVEVWDENTAGMRERLQSLNDFYEGKREEVDFPFGAGQSSSIDVRLAAAKARTLRAHFIRIVFADGNPFVAELLPGAKREKDDNLAEAHLNWSVDKATNGMETLKDTPIPCFRDGTALVYGEWERRIESGVEYAAYENAEQFQADYPDHKDAGVSRERYEEILEELALPDSEVHVEYEVDFVAQNGPVYTLVPLAKFIWFPLYARDLRLTADAYGYNFNQGQSAFEEAVAHGFYDADAAEECRKRSSDEGDNWDESRDRLEGITAEDDERVRYRIAKLVVCMDLNGDKVPERYKVWFDMDGKRCLRVEQYGLTRNVPNIVPFGFIRRDGRLLRVSLLSDGEDMLRSVNAFHRHRSNIRRLTDTVTLIVPKILKEDVDLGAEYAEFRPGMTLWVPNDLSADKYPRQLQLVNLSRNSDSMDEESLVARYLDGLFGISEGQSGRETPLDPGAPASKTRMLLERADMRIEDLVEEWRRTIPDFTELHNALYLQNGRAYLKFMRQTDNGVQEAKLRTAVLADPNRRFTLKAVRPSVTPEYAMNKIAALVATAFQMQFPVQLKPEMIVRFWNDYVTESRIPLPERFQIQIAEDGSMTMGGQPVDGKALMQQIQMMAAQGAAQKGATGKPGAKNTPKGA